MNNLPPGVSASSIPGNRKEDADYETFLSELCGFLSFYVVLDVAEKAAAELADIFQAKMDQSYNAGYAAGLREARDELAELA